METEIHTKMASELEEFFLAILAEHRWVSEIQELEEHQKIILSEDPSLTECMMIP